jgi:hypothetical protein
MNAWSARVAAQAVLNDQFPVPSYADDDPEPGEIYLFGPRKDLVGPAKSAASLPVSGVTGPTR